MQGSEAHEIGSAFPSTREKLQPNIRGQGGRGPQLTDARAEKGAVRSHPAGLPHRWPSSTGLPVPPARLTPRKVRPGGRAHCGSLT